MGNKSSCATITASSESGPVDNTDTNNNANRQNGNKGPKKATTASAKRGKKDDPLLEEIKLKVGKLAKEEIITKIEDKVLHELQNTPRYKQLITKPLWRESVQSLKPIDLIYRVS